MKNIKKPTILIVDDDQTTIIFLINALEDDYDIMVATGGREALDMVNTQKPDLILLDIMMPEMDGYEVCRRLKSSSQTRKIPVIFLTGMDSNEDHAKGLAAGAEDYIVKPFYPAVIRARVKIQLELYHQKSFLEETVKKRTAELEASKIALQKAMNNLQVERVTTGVFWVQVPEAGLYVLCGCPEEVVKHLMIKGFIGTVCKKDITFETGPNAILLSDVLIQNGCLSNLAEFPVLQMLYRQGFIIPDHPNNRGEKPVLIGSQEQVESQKQYIFRGNFGLIDKKEIMESGVAEPMADEMMRLKNRFRFGQKPQIEDLVDSVIVKNDPVEIRDQIFVKRTGFNRYEFSYKGLSSVVDLNLKPEESYNSPYLLGNHKIKRDYFAVIHSGEGNGWNTTVPSMGSIISYQGEIYLIDLPPNLFDTLRALGIDISEIVGVFHTHAHDDHFTSFPTLLQSDHRIKYFATPVVRSSVSKKLAALLAMDEKILSHFFDFHDLEFDQWNDCNGLDVKPIFSPHPVETNMFIFGALGDSGYKTYAHYADTISLDMLNEMVGDDPDCISLETYRNVKDAYLFPATLKKLDIGGGMIHGQALDFKTDMSEKIIMAHRENTLTDEQKEIGSESSFGQCDVLIPGTQDYLRSYAFHYLKSFFPPLGKKDGSMLLNSPLVEFNPGTLILKKGDTPAHLYLILTGTVEYIDIQSGTKHNLSNGSFIGEFSLFKKQTSPGLYRSVSHVSALSFSFLLFNNFLERNNISVSIENMFNKIEFLKSTWLFGGASSYAVQTQIAQIMKVVEIERGVDVLSRKSSGLFLIKTGEIEVRGTSNILLERLKPGDFFGEHHFFKPEITGFHFRAIRNSQLYSITDSVLLEIPSVYWKILEIHEKRRKKWKELTTGQKIQVC